MGEAAVWEDFVFNNTLAFTPLLGWSECDLSITDGKPRLIRVTCDKDLLPDQALDRLLCA